MENKERWTSAFQELERQSVHPAAEEIAAAVDGVGSPFAVAEIRAHVGWCASCQRLAEEFREFSAAPAVSPIASKTDAAWAAMQKRLPSAQPRVPSRMPSNWWWPVAAVLAISVGPTLWQAMNGGGRRVQYQPPPVAAIVPPRRPFPVANAAVVDLYPLGDQTRSADGASGAVAPVSAALVTFILNGAVREQVQARVVDATGKELWSGGLRRQSGAYPLALGEETLRQRPLTIECGPSRYQIRFGSFTMKLDASWWADAKAPAFGDRDAIVAIAQQLFPRPGTDLNGLRNFDQCGEIWLTRLLYALRHASKTDPTPDPEILREVQEIIDVHFGEVEPVAAPLPDFPVWASRRAGPPVAGSLSVIRDAVRAVRSVRPQWPAGAEILFGTLGRMRGMTAPGSPILLNLEQWNGGTPAFRRALIAHELFHHAQYDAKFRADVPAFPYAWFTEGSASWMEHAAGGALTSPNKLLATSSHPNLGLMNASYYAFPFWLEYCGERRLNVMKQFLGSYARQQDPVQAAGGASMIEKAHLRSLGKRVSGRALATAPVAVGGRAGAADQVPAVEIRAKHLQVEGGKLATSGSLPPYGSEIYDVTSSSPAALSVRVNPPLQATVYLPSGDGFQAAKGLTKIRPPFRVVVTAPGSGTGIEPFQVTIGTGAEAPRIPVGRSSALRGLLRNDPLAHVELDGFGNVLVMYRKLDGGALIAVARSVIGFQADAYASVGSDDPVNPADGAYPYL